MRTSKFRAKRFSPIQLLAAVLVTLLVTVLALFLAAWLTIGPEGLTLLEGMALVNTRFVGEYEKEKVTDVSKHRQAFTDKVHSMISEIFDPAVPFACTDDDTACTHCPYCNLCGV